MADFRIKLLRCYTVDSIMLKSVGFYTFPLSLKLCSGQKTDCSLYIMSVNLTAKVLKSTLWDTDGISKRSLRYPKPSCATKSWEASVQVQEECKGEHRIKHMGFYLQPALVDCCAVSHIAKAVCISASYQG